MSLRLSLTFGDRTAVMLAESLGLPGVIPGENVIANCTNRAFDASNDEDFATWYLRAQVFSKYSDSDDRTAAARQAKAFEKFFEAEAACQASNDRLVDPWTRASLTQTVWRRARGITASILGAFPWESFPGECAFGPGASSGLPRRRSSHQNKWALSTHITQEALPYYSAFRRWADLDIPHELLVVDSNKVTTVPKRHDRDRTIAIEPDWNMFLQKGVGSLIRRRLQRRGILLPEAQEINRALARLGSWTGSLATLDLSNASDSVSLALCEALLPDDWLRVIFALRSPKGVLPDGTTLTYGKVSSMGNGYTFELETLLFYALTTSVCRKEDVDNVQVYGDDIICPTWSAEEVIGILGEAGFVVNPDKSFWDGPFRESCGGHYWKGSNVTPFYLKQSPSDQHDLIVLGNSMACYAAQRRWADLGPFSDVHRQCRRGVSRFLRGPWGVDNVLWDSWDRCCPKWHSGTQSYVQKYVRRKLKWSSLDDHKGAYFHKLWVNVPDLEASKLPRALTSLEVRTLHLDRDHWQMPPVRLA